MAERFFIRTFGCQMNDHDSERIAGQLIGMGMEPAPDPAQADLVVLNTCCIRENADNKLYGTLGHLKSLKERRPGFRVAVGGCLAQKDRAELQRRAPYVDVVFGTHNLSRLGHLLELQQAEGRPVMEILEPADAERADATGQGNPLRYAQMAARAEPKRRRGHSAWVTIQVGCDNSCAFCIVPSVRGPEVSRHLAEIVGEVEQLAASGVVEVTLLGQNVNSYGRDLNLAARRAGELRRVRPMFPELLAAVGAVPGIERVRFTSPHPKDLSDETIAAMAETPAVCEQLHLPLQSGSDRVLSAMRRGYTAERYLSRLKAARAAISDLAVSTDIIVGFPGETEEDFEQTLAVVAEAQYDSAFTFEFSMRPGTRAEAMADQAVPTPVVKERFARLEVVIERSARAGNESRIGRIEEVLIEGSNRRDPTLVDGRTRQNRLVHLAAPHLGPGNFAKVEITGAGAHHLLGRVVA